MVGLARSEGRRQTMNKRLARTIIRNRRWRLIMDAAAVAAALGIGGLVYASDGTDVVGKLTTPTGVVDALSTLSGAIGANGDFSKEPNAGAVPFLGGAPGTLVSGLFDGFGDYPAVKDISVGPDDALEALDDQVKKAF